jgi:hypothetical protein
MSAMLRHSKMRSGAREARPAAGGLGLDLVGWQAVGGQVGAQDGVHGVGQPFFGGPVLDHGETPGLAVVGRRRPGRRLEQPLDQGALHRPVGVAPDRAPLLDEFIEGWGWISGCAHEDLVCLYGRKTKDEGRAMHDEELG